MAVESAIGTGLGVLGGLVALKSQSDLLNKKLRERNAAELATRQASEQMQRGVVGAAQQTQGGVGLLQGLRAADQMQRRALPQIQQAKMSDMARQDAFDAEQRQRQEKMWMGVAQGLGSMGTQLAMSAQPQTGPTGTPQQQLSSLDGNTLGHLTGMNAPTQLGAQSFEPQGKPATIDWIADDPAVQPMGEQVMPGGQQLAAPPHTPSPIGGVPSPPYDPGAGQAIQLGPLTPSEQQLVLDLRSKGMSDQQVANYLTNLRGGM